MQSLRRCTPLLLPLIIAFTSLQIFFFVVQHENDLREGGLKHITLEHSTSSHDSIEQTLPAFAVDNSEVFLAALIERSERSTELVLTSFLLCHFMLEPGQLKRQNNMIHPKKMKSWGPLIASKTKYVKYRENGQREETGEDTKFVCRIRNTMSSSSSSFLYEAEAISMPNRLSPDSNANRRLDVLRCKMEDSEYALKFLARSSASVHVEILRGTQSLINFTVPWETRRTGYLLSSPSWATRFDPWKGLQDAHEGHHHPDFPEALDRLYIASPGFEFNYVKSPNRKDATKTPHLPDLRTISGYVEYVQHHLSIGTDHIFLAVNFGWNSQYMRFLIDALREYIEDGLVSVSSKSGDGLDGVSSVLGFSMKNTHVENMFVTMSLYLSKGSSHLLGVWEETEFFIPSAQHHTIPSVFEEEQRPFWCYATVPTVAIFPKNGPEARSLWFGYRMSERIEEDSKVVYVCLINICNDLFAYFLIATKRLKRYEYQLSFSPFHQTLSFPFS